MPCPPRRRRARHGEEEIAISRRPRARRGGHVVGRVAAVESRKVDGKQRIIFIGYVDLHIASLTDRAGSTCECVVSGRVGARLRRNIATRVGTFEPPGDGHVAGGDWAGLAGPVLVDPVHLTNRLICQRGLDRCAFRGLGDLLDCALSALLERQLAAEGIAQIDNADHDEGENGRDQRQFSGVRDRQRPVE